MRRRIWLMALMAVCGTLAILFVSSHSAYALIPFNLHRVKYINADASVAYWVTTNEEYVYDTLPNEWVPSWSADSLRAGAVIIRSGAYWRTHRTELWSDYPNNNCYRVFDPGGPYYLTAPISRCPPGHICREQWMPLSRQPTTTSATDAMYQYHAERATQPADRPDPLVPLRYNSTIQNRTRTATGDWLQRVRYAYVGSGAPGPPFDPNVDCSQTDDQTDTDPIYTNQGTPTMVKVQDFRARSSWEWNSIAIVMAIALTGIGVVLVLLVGWRVQE